MGSRWFCRVLGEELGPLEFRNLREMVQAGTLREDDRVRRELAREWVRADSVIGLFHQEDVAELADAAEAIGPKVYDWQARVAFRLHRESQTSRRTPLRRPSPRRPGARETPSSAGRGRGSGRGRR